jgi:hypothetical protein
MYPVTYEADYQREHNRLTTFFRLILAIPWLIVAAIYAIAAEVVVIIAWFALLILGRYPDWAYDFVSGVVRYLIRLNGWVVLQTDEWPPFGIGPDPTYPIRVQVAPRAAEQSRLKALFRIILMIPAYIMLSIINYLHEWGGVAAWVTIVFRGYMPAGLHNALSFTNGYHARALGYITLLRDEYPPVGDEGPQVGDLPAGGQPAFSASTPATETQQAPPPPAAAS